MSKSCGLLDGEGATLVNCAAPELARPTKRLLLVRRTPFSQAIGAVSKTELVPDEAKNCQGDDCAVAALVVKMKLRSRHGLNIE
jgi:hypothetical protein